MKRIISIAAVCIYAAILLTGCNAEPRSYGIFCFDTYITLTLYQTDGTHTDADIFGECRELLTTLDHNLSAHTDSGELSEINAGAYTSPVKVSADTYGLIKRCVELSRLTDGAFDITLGEISRLWDFSSDDPSPPDNDTLKALAGQRNYENIALNDKDCTVAFTKDGFSLDLGAAAKGYALGLLKERIKSLGVSSAVIDFGGNIQTIGACPPGAEYYSVAVSVDETNAAIGRLRIGEMCVSTSNASRRYFEYEGERYHHIIDPFTAYPAKSDIKSATVLCEDGLIADALSTAFFVMGSDKAIALCDSLYGVEAVLTLNDNSVRLSNGAREIFYE